MPDREEPRIIPVVEEEVVADTRPVKTGSVRVQKHVQKSHRRVEAPLIRETAHVKRVPVNRVVEKAPEVRTEGDLIIVPVVEEELIVTKRLVLREELHIRRERTREVAQREVTVLRERAEVQHLDPEGRVIDEAPASGTVRRRRSVLD